MNDLDMRDVRVDTFSGGQVTVKVTHLPTGIVVTRTQIGGVAHRMRASALRELQNVLLQSNGRQPKYSGD